MPVASPAPPSPAVQAPSTAAGLRLHLLHNPRLERSDGALLSLADKDAALLALVVLDAPVPRGFVAHLLWPGDGSAQAARKALNNLRQRIFRLGRWAGREVVTQGQTLELAPGTVHDLALADPLPAPGPLLGSHDYGDNEALAAWVDAARQRRRSQRAEALIGLVLKLEDEGRLGEAVHLAQQLVADEPLMEHACRILMRLHHRRGDRGASLAEFERCRRALYEAHGEAPSTETIELSLAVGRADARATPRHAPLPLALRHPPRTVGREAALAQAELRWQIGGVVLLQGVAGIGKSRLMADLLQRWSVPLVLTCRADGGDSSFGLLALLAAALAPRVRGRVPAELSAWLDWLSEPQARVAPAQPVQAPRLVGVLRSALAVAAEGGLESLAIEDLHHADPASVEALCGLLPQARADGDGPSPRPRWLMSTRDAAQSVALQTWVDSQPAGAAPLVRLEPLDAGAVGEFMASLGVAAGHADAAQRLHAHCGGHPLFMLQVLRQLQLGGQLDEGRWPSQLPLPDDAMASASQRLTRAEPLAQQMAYLAALCGPDFTARLLCRLMGLSASQLLSPWRRLEELHIFGPHGFAHDLVREAVLSVVPQALAPLLHRDIALALQEEAGDPLRRAMHWQAAGEAAHAAADLRTAAALARSCGLMLPAIERLGQAATLLRQAGQPAAGFECDWEAGHLMVAYSSLQGALDVARRLGREASSPREKALAAELLARVKTEQHDTSGLTDAEAALAQAEALGDEALVQRCRLRLGEANSMMGRHARALDDLDAAGARPELLDAELRFVLATQRASVLASLGRREQAVSVQRLFLQQSLAERNLAHAASAAGFCATHLSYLCRVHESIAMAEQSLALARQAGTGQGLILVDEMGLAGNLGDLGLFDRALDIGERVIAGLGAAGLDVWAINASNDRAVIFLRLGRADLALQLLHQPIPDAPLWARAARRFVLARVDAWLGRPSREGIEEALAMFSEGGVTLDDFPLHKIGLEAARAAGAAQAAEAAARTIAWAQGREHVALARYASMVEIDALRRLGEHAAAATRAATLATAPGLTHDAYGYYLPEMLSVLSDALWADGRQAEGDALATTAVAWIEDCATRHVPPVFADSFRQKNPVNAELLRWHRERALR